MGLPPIIVNRTLRRQVMAVKYIRNILTPPPPPPLPHPHKKHSSLRKVGDRAQNGEVIDDHGREDALGLSHSGVHYEDPVAVHTFTRGQRVVKRIDSVPWDMNHHWNGDDHGHAHQEVGQVNTSAEGSGRGRSHSDGRTPMFNPIIWVETADNEVELHEHPAGNK